MKEKCVNCIHLAVCEKYEYDEDRKESIDFADENKVVNFEKYIGKKVKVLCDSWGNVWNYKTVEYGKYLIGEIVSITRTKKQTLIKIRAEHNVSWKRPCKRYPISAIGVTVFFDHPTEKGGVADTDVGNIHEKGGAEE